MPQAVQDHLGDRFLSEFRLLPGFVIDRLGQAGHGPGRIIHGGRQDEGTHWQDRKGREWSQGIDVLGDVRGRIQHEAQIRSLCEIQNRPPCWPSPEVCPPARCVPRRKPKGADRHVRRLTVKPGL